MKAKPKLLLTPKDVNPSFDGGLVKGVFNPGAVRMPDKKIALFVRVAESAKHLGKGAPKCPGPEEHLDLSNSRIVRSRWKDVSFRYDLCRLPTISHIKKVILNKDGFKVERVQEKPAIAGTVDDGGFGVEDPRIVKIGNKYVMTYVSVGIDEGVCTSIAYSRDLKEWKRQGVTFGQQNKDVSLFPEKIKGEYLALHRPEGTFSFSRPYIWMSYSKDLVYWGKNKVVVKSRSGSWDEDRVGGGAPPLKTKEGWLEIYHGVKTARVGRSKSVKKIYSAGAVLFDLKNPEKIIARSPKDEPLLSPSEKYEKKGFVNDVVFPSGAVKDLDGKSLLVYSGGSDRVVTVRSLKLKDVMNHLE